MRKITDQLCVPANNEGPVVTAVDEEPDGVCYTYDVIKTDNTWLERIIFQHGPIYEVGVNGITNEILLAIVIDRLRGFQAGGLRCRENAVALTKLEEALMWLKKRTHERTVRGVEGTNEV